MKMLTRAFNFMAMRKITLPPWKKLESCLKFKGFLRNVLVRLLTNTDLKFIHFASLKVVSFAPQFEFIRLPFLSI